MRITTVFTIKCDKGKENAAGFLTLAGGGNEVSSGEGFLERLSEGGLFKPGPVAAMGVYCKLREWLTGDQPVRESLE